MAIYEAGVLTVATAATADNAYAALWNTGSVVRLRIRELGITSTSATASKVALKRISARGTQTATQAGAPIDAGDPAAQGTLDFTYSVQPTVSGNYFRRAHLAATIGVGLVWSWWGGPGLTVAVSAGIALVTPTALIGQPVELYVVWEE